MKPIWATTNRPRNGITAPSGIQGTTTVTVPPIQANTVRNRRFESVVSATAPSTGMARNRIEVPNETSSDHSVSPDIPANPSSGTITCVKKGATMAPEATANAEFAQS